jgi:WD40 repeat protein
MRFLRFFCLCLLCTLVGLFGPANLLAQDESLYKHWRVLSWSYDQTVRLWDVESGEELLRIEQEDGISRAMMLDDDRILSYTRDILTVWDGTTGEQQFSIRKNGSSIVNVIMLPDTHLLIDSVYESTQIRTVELADSTNGEILETFSDIEAFFALPDGRFLIKTQRHRAELWNNTLTAPLFTFQATPSVQFSELHPLAGGRLVSLQEPDFVRIWDDQTGELLRTIAPPSRFASVRPAPDGNFLTTSWDDGVIVWDSGTGKQLINIHPDNRLDWDADFLSHSGIIVIGIEGRIQLWDVHTGEVIVTMTHDGYVSDLIELPDHRLLTASYDGTVRLWDGQTPQPLLMLRHPAPIYEATWLEGDQILSRGADGVIRLWDATTGAQVRQFHHDESVYGAVLWVEP